MKKALVAFAGLLIVALIALMALSSRSTLEVRPPVRVVGAETQVRLKVENPHGVRSVRAWLEQEGARHAVYSADAPSNRLAFFGKKDAPREFTFPVGRTQAPALKDGKARLVIEATANDFRGATDSLAFDVDVNTRPPMVAADGHQHYINQGGSELVTFNVSGYWTEAGVRVGKYTFRSFPIPGKDENSGERFAIFGFPWDTPADTVPVVYARNPSGAEATAKFWTKVFPKKFRTRDLEVSDAFLQKVVPQIEPGGTGELIDRFLRINGEMRRQNNQRLADLRNQTEPRYLWTEPFAQLSNSKVESLFADTRNYVYKGKKVDRQTHLGFDLSVTARVPVVAANSGKVVLAENLGIYGNCVVVDHGYGLQSIYAHLSQIEVKPGEMVNKSQQIGRSGETGLAGGDHLHFSMQIDGVQINPVEWWDAHWLEDRIWSKTPPPAK